MLLVFDIPPSRSVQSPSVSDTHTHTHKHVRVHTQARTLERTRIRTKRETHSLYAERIFPPSSIFFPH